MKNKFLSILVLVFAIMFSFGASAGTTFLPDASQDDGGTEAPE